MKRRNVIQALAASIAGLFGVAAVTRSSEKQAPRLFTEDEVKAIVRGMLPEIAKECWERPIAVAMEDELRRAFSPPEPPTQIGLLGAIDVIGDVRTLRCDSEGRLLIKVSLDSLPQV